MTSTPVMSSGNLQTVNYLNSTPTNGRVENSDFKNFMNQTGENLKNSEADTSKSVKAETVKKEPTDKNEAVKSEHKDNAKDVTEVSKAKETEREVLPDEADAVEDAIKEVVKVISDELDVTEEDIEKALENLGLTVFALLDTTTLPKIVAEITGSEDVLALTTDEGLYNSLTDITKAVEEIVNGLTEEINIPASEFEQAVKKFEIPNDEENQTKEPMHDDSTKDAVKINEKVQNTVETTQKNPEKSFESKIQVTDQSKSRSADNIKTAKTEVDAKLPETEVENSDFRENRNSSQNSDSQFSNSQMSFAENLLQKTAEALNETQTEVRYTTIDAENIMNQLTEQIKVDVNSETSEVNLRLHPESLGTVSVKVSSNHEGILTAQFTAQNESVKAIIESQAIVLKETLESKGVTVEAVEVTVQSHQFERNLSDQNKGNREASEPKKRGIRRINLAEPAEEVIETGDELVKEMMAQNGNSVDYSA